YMSVSLIRPDSLFNSFYYKDTTTSHNFTLSLHDALPILMAYKLKPKAMVLLAPASDMNNKDYLKVMAKTVFEGEIKNAKKLENNKTYEEMIAKIEDADIGGVKIHKNFLIDFIRKDIYGSASKYHGKVLIIRGTKDSLVFK